MAAPKRVRRADGSVAVKCSICDKKYVNRKALIDHIEREHSAQIPNGWSPARYENYLRTGKTEGKCVYCKKPTPWNDTTGKYGRMCGSEKCRETARQNAQKNYIGKHGKPYSINDPEQQKKMIYSRKNAGTYVFEDEQTGKKYEAMYDSSYGKGFLEMLDTFLFWPGSDIMAPSPHTYWYEYEGEKHFYIPDVYIYSLNLEVELKDGGSNPNTHPKIVAVDKVKERLKDDVMNSLKNEVNYIKICDKNYAEFFAMLSALKEKENPLPKWEPKVSLMEAYLPSNTDYSTTFSSYYLSDVKAGGGWDEEHFSKTMADAILQQLSNDAYREETGEKMYYVYTMGPDYFKTYKATLLGAVNVRWFNNFKDHGRDIKHDWEWDYQEEVQAEDCYDLRKELGYNDVQEAVDPVKAKVNLIKRGNLLENPVLNYDDLLEYYRIRLFHKKQNKKELLALYNELIHVRDYLKKVINGNTENDKRLNYEAKAALDEINRFIAYLEDDKGIALESTDVFSSEDFAGYGKYADLDAASAEIIDVKPLSEYTRIEMSPKTVSTYHEKCPSLWRGTCGDGGYIYIDESDEVVGFFSIQQFEWMTYLHHIEVMPKYRRNGIGDQLMDVAQSEFKVHYISVGSSNVAAINLFKKHGFGIYDNSESCCHMTDLQKTTLENTTVLEGVVSKLQKDYVGKEPYKLSDYRREKLNGNLVRKYKTQYPMLKHVREDWGDGYVWFDGDELVAMIHMITYEDGERWIHGFEITPKYRGHGLARQIMKFTTGELGGRYLSVNKKNEVAFNLYKKLNFKVIGESDTMYYMSLNGIKSSCSTLSESTIVAEACKDLATARKFVAEVGKLAKKYDANYFLVTDGASGTSNNGNPAVRHARQSHEEWERQNHFDPDEDWSKMWRVTYDGVGIYQAYKMAVDETTWRKFKGSKAAKWLPLPPAYAANNTSYFTYDGIEMFKKTTLPEFVKELNANKILIEELPIADDKFVAYKDKYQIVTKISVSEMVSAMMESGNDVTLSDILEFNARLNNMEYIVPNGGKIITKVTEEAFNRFYRYLTPKEFEKYNGGVCWDYVLYEAKYFDKNFKSVPYKTYFYTSEQGNTHTFLIFRVNNQYYWFESSWKDEVGVYGFKSENDAKNYVATKLYEDLRKNNNCSNGYLMEYSVDEIPTGVNCMQFMSHMIEKLDAIGDKKCAFTPKKGIVPIETYKGRIVYESTGLLPVVESTKVGSITYGQSHNDILDIIRTMTPTEQLYLGTPGGRVYNWARSEFYQEVLYDEGTPAAFLVVAEIPANPGVGHIIIGTRAGEQFRRKGYATKMMNRFLKAKHPARIKQLEWGFDDGNSKSYELASKFGFKNPTVPTDQLHHRGYLMVSDLKDIKPVSESLIPLTESTYIEATRNEEKYYPVFVFLSYTGTNMAKLIKSFTHDPYAHSSISFDTTLENMLSFNRNGMVDENVMVGLYKKKNATIKYSLYMYMATASEYDSMKNFVSEMVGKRSKLKYNVLGLTNFIFGRGSDREDKFFCSEFVASVISAGNNKVFTHQPYLVSPYMIAKNRNFIFIKKGILKNYDQAVVDKIVAEKLEEGGFTDVIIK